MTFLVKASLPARITTLTLVAHYLPPTQVRARRTANTHTATSAKYRTEHLMSDHAQRFHATNRHTLMILTGDLQLSPEASRIEPTGPVAADMINMSQEAHAS